MRVNGLQVVNTDGCAKLVRKPTGWVTEEQFVLCCCRVTSLFQREVAT